jgi:hypothetical protein
MESGQESQTGHKFFPPTSDNTRNMGPNEPWKRANIRRPYNIRFSATSLWKSTGRGRSPSLQLEIPYQLEPPLSRFPRSEVQTVINNLQPKSFPGYDLITRKILQELPPAGIKYLTQTFNAAMLTGYFPAQWKVAKIVLHLKPGKPPNEPMFYRPIRLLPILSKVYGKLLLHRLLPIIENRRLLVRLSPATLYNTRNSPYSAQNQRSTWN